MSDELKKIFRRELEELKQNKIRAGALAVCFVVLLIFWASDDSSRGEEIALNEPPTVDAPPPKNLPAKPLPVERNSDGVTLVIGANSDELALTDPFIREERTAPPLPPPRIPSAPVIPPQVPVLPPIPQMPPPREKVVLTGVAISGDSKTAMFLRGNETLFLTIGDEVNGRKIRDINPEFVTFEGGLRVYVQKELS